MFEQAVLQNGPASKRVWTTCLGFTGQAVLLGCALLAPIIWPQALPKAMTAIGLAAPGPPPARRPQQDPSRLVPQKARPAGRQFYDGAIHMPVVVPEKPAILIDEPAEMPGGVPGAVPGVGFSGGPHKGLIDELTALEFKPAPIRPDRPHTDVPKPPEPPRIVRVSELQMAKLLHRVEPQYPALARQARVSGTVRLEGIIATDGHLRQLTVLSGHPLLAPAALAAVRQWIYAPTVLNGEPVEVIAPIVVTFNLN
jgi:protein TonB